MMNYVIRYRRFGGDTEYEYPTTGDNLENVISILINLSNIITGVVFAD